MASFRSPDPTLDRREQIMRAAMVCFAKHGFHQTTMHDISDEAGISVGLIYRYFENKDAVISAMADEHKREIQDVLARARKAGGLFEALEILFTSNCCENAPHVEAAFVIDLFAEASRNPSVAKLVRGVMKVIIDGLTDLIARAPETRDGNRALTPRQLAELILDLHHGMMMRDLLDPTRAADRKR